MTGMADKQIRQQDNRQRAGGEPVRQSAGESSGDDRQARQRRAARSRRAAAARRRRERQIRIRMAILAVVFVVLAGGIGFAAFRIHRRNVMEQEAAAAASRKAAEEAAAEASRKAAEEAAEEASRKAAE